MSDFDVFAWLCYHTERGSEEFLEGAKIVADVRKKSHYLLVIAGQLVIGFIGRPSLLDFQVISIISFIATCLILIWYRGVPDIVWIAHMRHFIYKHPEYGLNTKSTDKYYVEIGDLLNWWGEISPFLAQGCGERRPLSPVYFYFMGRYFLSENI